MHDDSIDHLCCYVSGCVWVLGAYPHFLWITCIKGRAYLNLQRKFHKIRGLYQKEFCLTFHLKAS